MKFHSMDGFFRMSTASTYCVHEGEKMWAEQAVSLFSCVEQKFALKIVFPVLQEEIYSSSYAAAAYLESIRFPKDFLIHQGYVDSLLSHFEKMGPPHTICDLNYGILNSHSQDSHPSQALLLILRMHARRSHHHVR